MLKQYKETSPLAFKVIDNQTDKKMALGPIYFCQHCFSDELIQRVFP